MMWMARLTMAALVLVGAATAAGAQAAQSAGQPAGADYRSEFIKELDARAQKYIGLAEAFPVEKFTWRPAEGVRSVSEVFMHISAANFNLTGRWGKAPPAGFQVATFEKSTTEKAAVVAQLKASFAHIREAALAAPVNAEANHPWFDGSRITNRALSLFITGHMGEHLGQLIAYARMNGVKPPWSGEG